MDGREGQDGAVIILQSRCDPTPNLAGRGQWSKGEEWRKGYGGRKVTGLALEMARFVLCTWQWRRGHGMIEQPALGVIWQYNKDSEAANHRLEKQTLGTEVGKADGAGARARRGQPYVRGSWCVKYYAQQSHSLHAAVCEGTLAPSEPHR